MLNIRDKHEFAGSQSIIDVEFRTICLPGRLRTTVSPSKRAFQLLGGVGDMLVLVANSSLRAFIKDQELKISF